MFLSYLHRATPLYANTTIHTGHVHIFHWTAIYATYDGVCREKHSKSKVVSSENRVGNFPASAMRYCKLSSAHEMAWALNIQGYALSCFPILQDQATSM
jgi:hypothetical protein